MKTLAQIREVLVRKGFKFFDSTIPYDLNLIGVRTNDEFNNKFDDTLYIIYRRPLIVDGGKEDWTRAQREYTMDVLRWTTKSGLSENTGPEHPVTSGGMIGVGVLKEGQWIGCWQFNDSNKNHHKYPSLLQFRPVTVYRDGHMRKKKNDETGKVENFIPLVLDRLSPQQTGMFGINIHFMGRDRTPNDKTDEIISNWSIGCQGTPLPDFDILVDLLRKQEKSFKTKVPVSYTLLHDNDFK